MPAAHVSLSGNIDVKLLYSFARFEEQFLPTWQIRFPCNGPRVKTLGVANAPQASTGGSFADIG